MIKTTYLGITLPIPPTNNPLDNNADSRDQVYKIIRIKSGVYVIYFYEPRKRTGLYQGHHLEINDMDFDLRFNLDLLFKRGANAGVLKDPYIYQALDYLEIAYKALRKIDIKQKMSNTFDPSTLSETEE
jgi:hypothetical protein